MKLLCFECPSSPGSGLHLPGDSFISLTALSAANIYLQTPISLTIQFALVRPLPWAPAHLPRPMSSSFFSKCHRSPSCTLLWSPLFLEFPHVLLHMDNNENSEWSLIAKRAQHFLLLQKDPVLAGVAQGFIVWFTSCMLRSLTQSLACLNTSR